MRLAVSVPEHWRAISFRCWLAGAAVLILVVSAGDAGAQSLEPSQDQTRSTAQQSSPLSTEQAQQSAQPEPLAAEGVTAQIALPVIRVTGAGKPKQKRKTGAAPPQQAAQQAGAATAAQAALGARMDALDTARDNLLPKIGATASTISREAIVNLPQGDNTPIDKVVLQLPGVAYDSAVSNPSFHVRSEYSNVQTRINGVLLPEGVTALGPVLDSNFIGGMSLLTGTLPAQYGLHTAGVLDITSRSFAVPGGEASLYGGSRETVTPSFGYGGSVGSTEYFTAARGNWNDLGLENATPWLNAVHDQTGQGRFFGYASTLVDESTRLSVISAASYNALQIPNIPGQIPLGDFGPANYNSLLLNENQYETYIANIAAWQRHSAGGDAQFAVFTRYADVHFVPDVFGDLVFNDVASNIRRESVLNGTQFDASYIVNDRHTLRGGFAVSEEQTNVGNASTVLPVDPVTGAISPAPFTVIDDNSKLGWNIGGYLQDEWKLTDQLTLNAGLRFDQMYQYVDANQFSPRAALVYKPLPGTIIHAGYARYFTPPYQAMAAQSNIALFANTTNAPEVTLHDPVLPERSHYFDVGVDQTVLPGLTAGLDAYYKLARDFLDDGQFGAAVVLTEFNFARAYSEGGEFKLKYAAGNFNAYANFAYNITRAIDPVSNQYLLDAEEYAYLLNHYHYTDDMQRMTGSAGASYRFADTTLTADLIYGSGLRIGFANMDHGTPYAVANAGIAHDVKWSADAKPLTLRFDVINLFDQIYLLRSGTGIGEFAPQYGARRGYYAGVSQKL